MPRMLKDDSLETDELAIGGAVLESRLPEFISGPSHAAEIIRRLRIAVVSSGSVASRAADNLARMHVAELSLFDPARFKLESLLTHAISPAAVGHFKAEWVAQGLRRLGRSRVTAHMQRIQDVRPSLLADFDAVLLASDNLGCETYVGELCHRLGLPLFHAAVHGETLTAQVRTFANVGPESPCPACLFNDVEWQAHDEETKFSCQGGSVTRGTPTMSTPFLCSIAADVACTQIVRHFLGLGAPVGDTLVSHCGFTHRVTQSPLKRRLDCRCEHAVWRRALIHSPLPTLTADDLLVAAQLPAGSRNGNTLHVEGHAFACEATCCGTRQPIGRFIAAGQSPNLTCRECSQKLVVSPFHLRREAPWELLPSQTPLGELGVSSLVGALVGDGEQACLIHLPRNP